MHGGKWLGAAGGIEQALRFLRNMAVARLLAPEAFGLMAIVMAVNSMFEAFTQIGIKEAVVQSPRGEEHAYLNGAWWLALARGAALFGIAYICAPWVAGFYDAPELSPMLRLSFLGMLFLGGMSPGAYVALKRMRYRQWVLVSQGGGVLGILTAILLAFVMRSVWALVIGYTAEFAARCVLSHVICPFRPALRLNRGDFQALMRYAGGMFGLPVLYLIFTQADVFFIGKLMGRDELGIYSMAAALARVPSLFIPVFINPILLPVFSSIQGEKEKINGVIMESTYLMALIGFPVLFFVALYGGGLLNLVYGPQYTTVAVPFAILFATCLAGACSSPIAALYLGLGRPGLHRLFTGIRAMLVLLLVYPFLMAFGLSGAAMAGLVAMAFAYVFQVARIRGITGLDLGRYGGVFLKAACLSLPVPALWAAARKVMPSAPMGVLPGVIGCMLAYGLSAMVFLPARMRHESSLSVNKGS